MTGRRTAFVAAVLLVAAIAPVSVGTGAATASTATDVVVVFTNETARSSGPAVVDSVGGTVTGGRSVEVVPVLFATVPEGALSRLRHAEGVSVVERDHRVAVVTDEQATAGPGDVSASKSQSSWSYERVRASAARAEVSESAQAAVDVAVVDTGVDADHPDLEVAWGIDVVGNGSTEGVAAADDDQGHGTHVAGIVAAQDDGTGVTGVTPGVDLYAVKSFDRFGVGSLTDFLEGIDAAVAGPDGRPGTDDDADVIVMSVGGLRSPTLRRTLDLVSRETVVVAAAGNGGRTTDDVDYPAAYETVVAVGATDRSDTVASFSDTGPSVELAAPGVDIRSTAVDGGYTEKSGTSFATPFVAGGAALVLADDLADGSHDLSTDAVRRRLQASARDVGQVGWDFEAGHGLLQVDDAVDPSHSVEATPTVDLRAPADGATIAGSVPVRVDADNDGPVEDLSVSVSVDEGPWREARYDPDVGRFVYEWAATDLEIEDATVPVVTRVRDDDGYVDADAVSVTVDTENTPPAVEVITPNAGKRVAGFTTVEARVEDDRLPSRAVNVTYNVEGGSPRGMSYDEATGRFRARWLTTGVLDGRRTVTVVADDGTDTTAESVTVDVANSAASADTLELALTLDPGPEPEPRSSNTTEAEKTTIAAGGNVTVGFVVENTGDRDRFVSVILSRLPDGWRVLDWETTGSYAPDRREFFRTVALGAGETYRGSVTLGASTTAGPGEYDVGAVAVDGEGNTDGTLSTVVVVGSSTDPVVVFAGPDRVVQAGEVLDAIVAYNRGRPVGPDDRPVTAADVLELITFYNAGGKV
jgi:subtilisin family serine protease